MPSTDPDKATLIGHLGAAARHRLRTDGLGFRIGPFAVRLQSSVAHFDEPFLRLYRDHPLVDTNSVYTCHLKLSAARHWRRPWQSLLRLTVDGRPPHEDMPPEHAFAVFEWGLNLVLALRMQRYLMFHAAVVALGDRALMLPAAPGAGKSTLCTALVSRGWRLLSDEFGLCRPETVACLPLPRPIPIKNQSIAVLRTFAPDMEWGPELTGTRKGTVAHLRPPAESVHSQDRSAIPCWLVFPRWQADQQLTLAPIPKADAMLRLAGNAFNYGAQGEAGFRATCAIVDGAACYDLVYSDLDSAVAALTDLAARSHGA